MKKNSDNLSHLFTALGTAIFLVAGMPILESVSTWISNIFNLKTLKINAEAEKITGKSFDEQQEDTHVIGFQIPSEEDEVKYDE